MVSEVISARLGTTHPEDNPALAGCCPPPAGRRRPLVDPAGRPLLPRIVRALRKGLTLQHQASVVPRAVTGQTAGAAFDPAAVLRARERAWELRGEMLGSLLVRSATALRGTVRQWVKRARGRHDLRTALQFYASLGQTPPWMDMGGSRNELLDEASKPFWRA